MCGNEKIKGENKVLRKLLAVETLNNTSILSQKRQEKASSFNVRLLDELNNFLREIMAKLKLNSIKLKKLSSHLFKGKHFSLLHLQ